MNDKLKLFIDTMRKRFEAQLLPRYQQLEEREQRVVLTAVLLLPLMIIVFGLILPLQEKQDALRSEVAALQIQAAEAERLALYLTEHAAELNASGGASESLLSTVERLARQTKVREFMTRIKPQPSLNSGEKQLMVSIKDAPYDAILRFIHALASHNIGLNSLKFQATDSPGRIHVSAVIAST